MFFVLSASTVLAQTAAPAADAAAPAAAAPAPADVAVINGSSKIDHD